MPNNMLAACSMFTAFYLFVIAIYIPKIFQPPKTGTQLAL